MEVTSAMTVPTSGLNSTSGVSATVNPESRQSPPRLSLSSQDPTLAKACTDQDVLAPSCGARKTVSIMAIAPTKTQLPCEANGATVFVGAGGGNSSVSATAIVSANAPTNWTQASIPEAQTVNSYGTRYQEHRQESQQQRHIAPALHVASSPQPHSSQPHHTAQHVVKIRINPELEKSRVISTVRLNPELADDTSSKPVANKSYEEANGTATEAVDDCSIDDATRSSFRGLNNETLSLPSDSRVRISVVTGNVTGEQRIEDQRENKSFNEDRSVKPNIVRNRESTGRQDEMLQQQRATTNDAIHTTTTSINRVGACLYLGSCPNSLTTTMTSGQCSPSDTLDSGTCSDLDGTPPPLPKKKNSSTVLLGVNGSNGGGPLIGKLSTGSQQLQTRHKRAGSVTSSGPDLDSDDNESNISCDSLNSGELAARIVEHRSIRVNGMAVADGDDLTVQADNHGDDGRDIIRGVAESNGRRVKVSDHDDCAFDVKNNNNNNDNINNNNKNDLTKNNEHEIANGIKVNVDREMNERNNGNIEATDSPILSTELMSASRSSESPTSGPSPSVSPSPSGASSLSKASSTPRVRSPVSNGPSSPVQSSPVIRECTYEERKREQDRINEENAAADYYANYNRKNGTKYLYDDDRFYKFHIHENQSDNENDEKDPRIAGKESDEFFAGYKILDREAIRSAKGTVRGVKNRVRAGIATFLQKTTNKNYKTKDAGKIVVYVTSMSIVRETYNACLKMLKFLKNHMVEHEVRDLSMSKALQTELKERLGCETVHLPQLFIDGQHIGNADTVERLNESGELRDMFKPWKNPIACATCTTCGGCRFLPCPVCNGSKKSPVRNDFMKEFYWLRCMNCDEVGLVGCDNC